MSEEKVTPIQRLKGTPKRMRPRLLRASYYVVALLGIFHILSGLYLYYETGILPLLAPNLALQPPTIDAIVEVFSGVFAIAAAFGLRRLAYWGGLSSAVFGVFELWNSVMLKQIIEFGLSSNLGTTLSTSIQNDTTIILQAIGVLVLILSATSLLSIRKHKMVAAQVTA